MYAGRLVSIVFVASAACAADDVTRIEVAGDLIFWALTDAANEIVEAKLVLKSGELRFAVPAEPGEHLFVAGIERPRVIGAGGPLSDEQLAELSFAPFDPGESECRRCLVESSGTEQVMLPGQSCPLPAFAEPHVYRRTESGYVVDDELIEPLRARLRWKRDGPCAPPFDESRAAPDVEICPLLPSEGPIRAPIVALHKSGAAFAANEGFMWSVSREGTVRTRSIVPAHIGSVVAAVALPGEPPRYLYAAFRSQRTFRGVTYRVVDEELRERDINDGLLKRFAPDFLRVAPDGRALFMTGSIFPPGGASGDMLAIVRCEVAPDGSLLSCGEESQSCEFYPGAIEIAENGTAVVFSRAFYSGDHQIAYRPPDDAQWYCDRTAISPLTPGQMVRQAGPIDALGMIGNRAFLCLRSTVDNFVAPAVINFEVPALGNGTGLIPPSYQVSAHSFRNGDGTAPGCGRFLRVADYPDRALAILPSWGALAFDENGTARERLTTNFEPVLSNDQLGPPLYGPDVNTSAKILGDGDPFAYVDASGAVYRRDALGELPVRRYGNAIDELDRFGAVVPLADDRMAVMRAGAGPLLVERGGSECSQLRVASPAVSSWTLTDNSGTRVLPAFPDDYTSSYAVADSRAPDRIIALGASTSSRSLDVIDLSRGEILQLPRSLIATGMAEVAPGELIVASLKELYAVDVDDGSATDIPVDGPVPADISWRSVGASGGIAWVAGDRTLARIVPTATGRRAQTDLFTLLSRANEYNVIDTILVLAPDEVLVFGRLLQGSSDLVTMWRVGPPREGCVPEGGVFAGLVMCRWEAYLETAENAPPYNDLSTAAVADGGVVSVFFGASSTIFRNSAGRVAAPFTTGTITAGARAGWFVFGGSWMLAAGLERRP